MLNALIYINLNKINMEKYYKILGLKIGASVEEIENRHKELLSEFDPTKHADDNLKDFYQKNAIKLKKPTKKFL